MFILLFSLLMNIRLTPFSSIPRAASQITIDADTAWGLISLATACQIRIPAITSKVAEFINAANISALLNPYVCLRVCSLPDSLEAQ
jgi:hypothetical protein